MRNLAVCIICLPLVVTGQPNKDSAMIKRIADDIMTNGKAYDLLRELTKGIGGRLAGSPEQQHAAIWGKAAMEALDPDKVFFSHVKHLIGKEAGKILPLLFLQMVTPWIKN